MGGEQKWKAKAREVRSGKMSQNKRGEREKALSIKCRELSNMTDEKGLQDGIATCEKRGKGQRLA